MNYSQTFKIEPAGEREIVMTRVFNASADLVFDALTRPETGQTLASRTARLVHARV